jgi:hypothetical protein
LEDRNGNRRRRGELDRMVRIREWNRIERGKKGIY